MSLIGPQPPPTVHRSSRETLQKSQTAANSVASGPARQGYGAGDARGLPFSTTYTASAL